MYASAVVRLSSRTLHSIMGGTALFCLYYAGIAPDFDGVRMLLIEALKWGLPAAAILYCQHRYLDK
jgi:hypothetical protein